MEPIFIGGTGRSGTTILKTILTRHTQVVAIAKELRLLVDPDGALDLIDALSDRWSPHAADTAIQRFLTLVKHCSGEGLYSNRVVRRFEGTLFWGGGPAPRSYPGMHLAHAFGHQDYRHLLHGLVKKFIHHETRGRWIGSAPRTRDPKIFEAGPAPKDEVRGAVATCFRELYGQMPEVTPRTTHWLDDTPYNMVFASELCAVFPRMRFIHMYRDPRDVLASYRTFRWGGDNYEAIARRLGGLYGRWFEVRAQLAPESYREVALEHLVAEPRATLQMLSEFIGLPFEASLLEVALDKAHTGRWKRDVPAQEMERALPHLRPALQVYGYPEL